LPATQVYAMAAICLVAGLAIGYVSRGSHSSASPAQSAPVAQQPSTMSSQAQPAVTPGPSSPHAGPMGGGRMPTMQQMKQMADNKAAPLLEKLKSDPNNTALLLQVGAIYHATHQFKDAATYYGKAVETDPKNVGTRNKLASSLYRSGDVDGAIAQLNQALSYDPKDANSLFNLGTIRLQGKQDGKGALAAWQQLLKSNPQLSADRKAAVLRLMADVQTTLGDQRGIEGARSDDKHK